MLAFSSFSWLCNFSAFSRARRNTPSLFQQNKNPTVYIGSPNRGAETLTNTSLNTSSGNLDCAQTASCRSLRIRFRTSCRSQMDSGRECQHWRCWHRQCWHEHQQLRSHIDLQRAMTSKRSKTSCDRAKDRRMTFARRCILNAPRIFVHLLMLAPDVCGRPLDDYTQTVSL